MRPISFAVRCWTLAVLLSLASCGWAAEPATAVQAPAGQARILVLTGNEYPGHK